MRFVPPGARRERRLHRRRRHPPVRAHRAAQRASAGRVRVRAALSDAGVEWRDIQFAYGGSDSAGNADTLSSSSASRACSSSMSRTAAQPAAPPWLGAYCGVKSRRVRSRSRGRLRQASARRVRSAARAVLGLPAWYGESGLMLTTQFFAMKTAPLHARARHHAATLGARRGEGVRQRRARRARLATRARRHRDDPQLADGQRPVDEVHVLLARRGRVALVLASEKKARELGRTNVRLKAAAMRTRPAGSFEVFAPSLDLERGHSATVIASRAAFEMAGIGPEDIDVAQLQDTESGAEIMHMAENGFCRGRRAGSVARRGPHAHRRPAADQHRRRLPRVRRADRCLGPAAGLRERRAAARPGRRATGARQAADGVQPRLRRARRIGRGDPRALRSPWTWNSPPAQQAFREEIRAFLAAHLPERLREGARCTPTVFAEPDIGREWQRILYDKGWLAYNWPAEFGGTGWSPVQRYLFEKECALADAPGPAGAGSQAARPRRLHVRHAGAAEPLPAEDSHGRALLVPGFLRTGRRLRSREPADPCGARRRPLYRQRQQDLDDARAFRRSHVLPRAHRSRMRRRSAASVSCSSTCGSPA